MGSTTANAEELATRLRREGQLLGVYIIEPTHHYRFPSWQLRLDGRPVEHFAEILGIMREHGLYLDENRRIIGWGEVEWFLSPHVLLDGHRPCDVLSRDPQAVLEAARVEFVEEENSGGF